MLEGVYYLFLNRIAGNEINRIVDIPSRSSGIGETELLNPILAVPVYRGKLPKKPDILFQTLSDIDTIGRGAIVEAEDFPASEYIGELM